jgi:hypothetical protein
MPLPSSGNSPTQRNTGFAQAAGNLGAVFDQAAMKSFGARHAAYRFMRAPRRILLD